jgi:two-component system sensor kinase FixL
LKRGDPAMREPIIKALDDAGQETLRAGEILRRLRDFLSRGELEKTFEDAGKLAEDAISFESALARYRNVHCTIECASDLTPILVDRVQIQQVILNLVKNAVQSIGRDDTVRIAITPANKMMRFKVSDTGPGVPPARIGRLFDPFSTTKTEGMGLGLPICRSIIEAHGGMIWYETAPGGGAAFIFTIPRFQEESDDAQ